MASNIEYLRNRHGKGSQWNPVTGCGSDLPCFARCWARQLCHNWSTNPVRSLEDRAKYRDSFTVGPQLWPERLHQPLHWKRPRIIGVCFMGDLFHDDVPELFILEVFQTMAACQQHTFLLLTKRVDRMADVVSRINYITTEELPHLDKPSCSIRPGGNWPMGSCFTPLPNVYLGVSVSGNSDSHRVTTLLRTPADHHFISYEPALEALDLEPFFDPVGCFSCGAEQCECPSCGVVNDWYKDKHGSYARPEVVIVGGESGIGASPMHPDWPRKIRHDTKAAGVHFFFKQWGEWLPITTVGDDPDPKGRSAMAYTDGTVEVDWEAGPKCLGAQPMFRVGKKKAGKLLDGHIYDKTPWGQE